MDILAERIKQAREVRGLSQAKLAELAGYTSRASINKIEKGLVDIPRSKVDAIAKALHVSPVWLLGLTEKGGSDTYITYMDEIEPLIAAAENATREQIIEAAHYLEYLKRYKNGNP
jgi:transcriptional regulator with XRE-family HTH domain